MVAGSRLCQKDLNRIIATCHRKELGEDRFDPKKNQELKEAIATARSHEILST